MFFLETASSVAAEGAPAGGDMLSSLVMLVPMLLMLVLLYFVMIRPQRKKEKETAQMRNAIEIGDGVTTIGGIVGRVASIKEDTFVLETGNDRVKLRFNRWAIQEVEKLNMDADATADKKEKADK